MIIKSIQVITCSGEMQDYAELGARNYGGNQILFGWILEDGTMIYTRERPLYHPKTGEQLTLSDKEKE